ncbi:MAG: DUF6067 family protein [Kiritimatiellae bacterium]|nr:DUF6067 family protein [Kiritimatiellia bacterium]
MNRLAAQGWAGMLLATALTLRCGASSNMVAHGDFTRLAQSLPYANWTTEGKVPFQLVPADGTGENCIAVSAAPGQLAAGETASFISRLNAKPVGHRFLMAVEARGTGRLRLYGLEYEGSFDQPVFMGSDHSPFMDLTPEWRWYLFEYEVGEPARLVQAAVSIQFQPADGKALEGQVRQVVVDSLDTAVVSDPQATPTELTIPLLAAPSALKGDLSDPVWSRASRFSGFVANRDAEKRLSPRENTLMAFRTDDAIYLGLHSRSLPGKGLVARVQARDANIPIYYDDNFEIGIVPPATNRMYQFLVNAMGSVYDGTFDKNNFNGQWNSQVEVAVSTNGGAFTLEMKIPAADMSGTGLRAGEVWRLVVVRNYRDQEVFYEDYLTPLKEGFRDWDRFAHLTMGNDDVGVEVRLAGCASGLADLGVRSLGSVSNVVFTRSLTDVSEIETAGRITVARAARNVSLLPRAESVLPAGGRGTLNLALRYQPRNRYRCELFLTSPDGRSLARLVRDFSAAAPLALKTDIDCVRQTVTVDIDAAGLPVGDGQLLPALIEIERKDDPRVLVSRALTIKPGGMSQVALPIHDLGDGVHLVDCTARDQEGHLLAEAVEPIRLFKNAYWRDNGLGEEDVVPPPYTPPRFTERETVLENWGHRIALRDGVLPAQISVEGVSLLAAPIELTGRIDGKPYRLSGSLKRTNAGRLGGIELAGKGRTGIVRATVKLNFEYDGFLRADTELTGKRPFTIENLALRIPVRDEIADVLLNKLTTSWREALPQGGMTFLKDMETVKAGYHTSVLESDRSGPDRWDRKRFWGQLTIMNMERGLSWFTESDEFWSTGTNDLYAVERSEGRTTLVVKMVSVPVTTRRWPFTFGLQATPVRPPNPALKREQWAQRVQHAAAIPDAADFASIVTPGANMLFVTNPGPGLMPLCHPVQKKLLIMDPWIVIHHPPDEADQRAIYRRTVEFWTQPGRRLAIYNNPNYVYRPSPEYQYFKALWGMQSPGSFWEWDMIEVNRACRNFQDFWIYHHHAMLERFPENYIQLDCPTIQPDNRAINGMGYDRDGKRHATLNIFETRRMYKRAYVIATRLVPNVYYSLHQSGDWAAAALAFCNTTAEGEEWRGWTRHQFEAPGRNLDFFRYLLASRVGPERLFMPQIGYGAVVRGKTVHATGTYLLHNIPFERSNGDGQANREILTVMDRIGLGHRDDLVFHPYWKPEPEIRSSEPHLKISYWTRTGGAFLVVANVDWNKTSVGTVTLAPSALGLKKPKITLYDPMENRFTDVAGSEQPVVKLEIPAALFQMILIEEAP